MEKYCIPSFSPIKAVKSVFCNPTFSGRSRRSEFWWFTLFYLITTYIAQSLCESFAPGWNVFSIVAILFVIVLTYYAVCVQVRRFHDVGLSGWWMGAYGLFSVIKTAMFKDVILLSIISLLLGTIILIICMRDSKKEQNRYGISPKYATSEEEIEELNEENESNWEIFKERFLGAIGCLTGSMGCLFFLVVFIGFSTFIARWLCTIDPEEYYVWYEGIWHGLFVIPNWIMSWFYDDILCKAENYSTGYNVCWWIVLIWEILGFIGGGTQR